MGDVINDVINSLAGIEETAGKIMAAADDEKKSLYKKNQDNMAIFSDKLGKEYERKLEVIKDASRIESNREITKLTDDTDVLIAQLDDSYNKNKDKWVNDIFSNIIGV